MWLKPSGELKLAFGLASRTGRRPDNQDFVAAYAATPDERVTHGAAAMLADGVGGAKGGRISAELACRSFVEAYYSQPATLGVAVAAERALSGFNRWLHGMAASDPAMAGAATTFSALVLRDRFAHVLHVGDSRIWRLREETLVRLTTDHAVARPEQSHILYRAVGLEPTVRLDYAIRALEPHDRFLITSDGVHGAVSEAVLEDLARRRGPPDRDAEAIVEAALSLGSADNASAVVIDVVALPDPDHAGLAALAAGLPVLATPKAGETVDGFRLERELADGEHSKAFQAVSGDERFLLKFPKPQAVAEHIAREGFIRELLIGARVQSPYVAEVLQLPPDSQSRVYTVMPFYPGRTLEAVLKGAPMDYAAGVAVAAKLARGVSALHRMGVIHRDIKPENVQIGDHGEVRLLDLSAARIPGLDDPPGAETPGSQGYIAPELYNGEGGSEASDQFALGATLYRLFTGRFPFDDLQALQRPGFDSPADPIVLRGDMPAWLAYALRRAVQARPEDRFDDVTELLHVLEQGEAKAIPRLRPASLAERNPLLLWRLIALALGLALIASLIFR
ncbi:MAG: bifunctional protein-serine/threonine kinase/phosphatase [Caulobacteraceae bacterium]|nr:bifunctional protein-serine/threonine kinase/phosphatase [Caulobacteraceae bacterium]